jgi:hypothetical protein
VPLVFVHGVNTRRSKDYDAAEVGRDAMFRRFALAAVARDPDAAEIFNPYWGDKGARFPWNYGFAHDSQQNLEAFGASSDVLDAALRDAGVAPTPENRNDVLLSVARVNFTDAVDLLWTAAASSERLTTEDAAELAAAAVAVHAYTAAQGPAPPEWVTRGTVTTDGGFIERLMDEAEAYDAARAAPTVESFGGGSLLDRLKRGAARTADRAADASFGSYIEGKLPDVLRRFSGFFGDVFEYIKQRSSGATAITDIVLDDLRKAAGVAAKSREKLVCVGHSMGGDILYDLLTDASLADMPDCDLLVTVGSQVGLFEELKLFRSSVEDFPPNATTRVPASRHPRIKRWINVFDRADPFGYPATTIFEGTRDFVFDTRASSLSAHGAYFLQPTFHARLLARIAQG